MPKKKRKPRKPQRNAATPSKPMTRKKFEREMRKVVAGEPGADPHVRAFFDDVRTAMGVEVAVPHPEGVEVLRRPTTNKPDNN